MSERASALDRANLSAKVTEQIDRAVDNFRGYALAKYTKLAADGGIPCAQVTILTEMDCAEYKRRLWDLQRSDRHKNL